MIDKNFLFQAGSIRRTILCQWNIDHKIWGALRITVRGMYRFECLFDKAAYLFIDSSVMKAKAELSLHASN
jgi:hypothetical protein